jgi:hypothetical protein
MQFTFVGCGDAFGSGGRLNTCFHVKGEHATTSLHKMVPALVASDKIWKSYYLRRPGLSKDEFCSVS